MAAACAVFFCMGAHGHVPRLRPLIAGLASRGIPAHVFSDRRFARMVRSAGGSFVDLFAGRPLESADGESQPIPVRFVTFAARHAAAVVREAAALRPTLVVYDSFAVIGRVVAAQLALPAVNVCAGHNVQAERFRAGLAYDARVRLTDRCLRAAELLRERWGLADASPFCYVGPPSRLLNVYCEPREYLSEPERRRFEPVVFFGSLPPASELERRPPPAPRSPFGVAAGDSLKLYASLGTAVWLYWQREALLALRAVADAAAERPTLRVVLSLGGAAVDRRTLRALARPNVAVARFADQWSLLREADAFVTHHGLNSTHEAIFHGVPMLSLPYFWDQPALAAKCQELGLALPLGSGARAPLAPEDVLAALDELAARRFTLRARLAEARRWELRTVEERAQALDRIVAIAAGG